MRLVATLAVCLLFGCAALRSAPADPSQQKKEPTVEGIGGISRSLRDSLRKLEAQEFKDSLRLLRLAERAIQNADDVTRSHPDFEDLETAVDRARDRIEKAIEEDRIARRNAAIDDLMRKADFKIRQGTTLFTELRSRVPTRGDLENMGEIVATLGQLADEGQQYNDEARYVRHAKDRDAKIAALRKRRDQARWQVSAQQKVGRSIEQAYAAATRVSEAEAPSEFVAAFRDAATAFTACANTVSDLASDDNYAADLLVQTRLGIKSLGQTKRLCTERAAKARKEGDRREWDTTVKRVIVSIGGPVQAVRAAKRPADAMRAADGALEALKKCQTALDAVARHPGTDAKHAFDTVLGKLTASRLRRGCAGEEARIRKEQPRLKWRGQLDETAERLAPVKVQIDRGRTAKAPQTRVDAWRVAVGGMKECAERTRALGRDSNADRGFTVKSPFGKVAIAALQKECDKRLADSEVELGKAQAAVALEEFIAGCKADEIAVARREGIPDRVETVEGGRMFVYVQKGKGRRKEARHFGFDTAGKRVDFRLKWLSDVGAVVSEVSRALDLIKRAKTGKVALRATNEALPSLQVCAESLKIAGRSPGYDAGALFTTPMGKLSAVKLGEACGSERAKRASSLVGLEWRIRLEALRDRVDSASAELGQAKAAKSANVRSEKISAAVGGFQECLDRIDPLGREQGVDWKLKVDSSLGKLTLKAFGKACTKQLASAKSALDAALKAKEVEDFVASCTGDEVAVAKREGMPTRIEEIGDGRVFVYQSRSRRKTRSKRFGFNAAGKRVDEKLLKAAEKKKAGGNAPSLQAIPKK